MFKVIDDTILFRDEPVGKIDPKIRETLRRDVIEELESHVAIEEVENLARKVTDFEEFYL